MAGLNLQRDTCVFVRGFDYMDPVVPRDGAAVDWSVWQVQQVIDQQRFSTQYSVLSELSRRGVEVINAPAAHLLSFMRHDALERCRAAGVPVPPLLTTNEADVAARFESEHGPLLWRPAQGRAAWQRFGRRQAEYFVNPEKTPVLLAPVREGGLLRCWLLRGEPLLCLARAPADNSGLETLEAFWPVADEASGVARLPPAAKVLGAPWIELTFLSNGTDAWLYDVDTDPRLDWLPDVFRSYLLAALAAGLAGTPRPALPESAATRAMPFLRRMLQDLFAYEATKYEDDSAPS